MKKILKLTILISTIIFLCSCGAASEEGTEVNENYLENLEDDCYYVRDKNNNCKEVYFGTGTFDWGDISTYPSDDRVLWFKEDFEEIPTLYRGDSLIYYTQEELIEEFTFERFEDYGYSIGICGLTETTSGRYSISTDPSDCNTYPYSDTDEILQLTNDIAIIDTLGGVALRSRGDNQVENDYLTRSGSIKGLKKDNSYKAEIYEGTIRNEYTFKADVRILGSMEVTESTDYVFESEKIINIRIPGEFKSGYYMINGVGLFRYVAGDSYDDKTDFNVPNLIEELTSNDDYEANKGTYISENVTANEESYDENTPENTQTKAIPIEEKGKALVLVNLEGITDYSKIEVTLTSPSGTSYKLDREDKTYKKEIDVKETGFYTVEVLNSNNAIITIEIH